MRKKDRQLISRSLDLLNIYLKGRTVSRISIGFIGGGISILGFSNFLPYLTILIRPELSQSISVENNVLTYIGITMIIIGSIIPPAVKVFNYYIRLYKEDLQRINEIYSVYDYDSYRNNFARIGGTFTMFDYEIDRLEDLYYFLLNSDFYFHNKRINQDVKSLGNELREFSSRMSLRVSPSNGNPRLYNMPKNHPDYQSSFEKTSEECNKLIEQYKNLKLHFDRLTHKNILRFFA